MDDCILWTGCVRSDGYGRRTYRGKPGQMVQRVAYEQAHGPIPDGLTVDHLCFTKTCINPAHLRLLTRLENQRNQRSAFKDRCVNGHEFTPENTYIRPARHRSGKRDCRTCIRARVAAYRARRSAA